MTHWQFLGLEPCNDERLVRKAYAKQLKRIDQDLEPELFIQLRQFFERALSDIHLGFIPAIKSDSDITAIKDDGPNEHTVDKHSSVQVDANPSSDGSRIQAEFDQVASDPSTFQENRTEFFEQARVLAVRIRDQDTDSDLKDQLESFLHCMISSVILRAHEKEEIRLDLNHAAVTAGLSSLDDLLSQRLQQLKVERDVLSDLTELPPLDDAKLESHSFSARLEQVRAKLWACVFDNETYDAFVQLITDLPQQSLSEQMTGHDQLIYALAIASQLNKDFVQLETERFVLFWLQTQGNEPPLVNAHPSLHALYNRMVQMQPKDVSRSNTSFNRQWSETLKNDHSQKNSSPRILTHEQIENNKRFWQTMPAEFITELRNLESGEGAHWWQMLRLVGTANPVIRQQRRQHWASFPVKHAESNFDLHLLQRMSHLLAYLPNLLVVVIANTLLQQYFFQGQGWPLFVQVVMFLLWVPLIQIPLNVWMQVRAIGRRTTEFLTTGWIISALVLAFSVFSLSPAIQTVLLYLWALVGAILLGHAMYGRQTLFYWLVKIGRIKADRRIILGGFLLLIAAIIKSMLWFITRYELNFDVSLLVLLPLVCIVCPTYFRDVIALQVRRFFLWLYSLTPKSPLQGIGFFCFILFVILVELIQFHLLGLNLAFTWVLSTFLYYVFLSSPRKMAYFIKYASYIGLIIGMIASITFGVSREVVFGPSLLIVAGIVVYLSYLLNRTYDQDKVAWQRGES